MPERIEVVDPASSVVVLRPLKEHSVHLPSAVTKALNLHPGNLFILHLQVDGVEFPFWTRLTRHNRARIHRDAWDGLHLKAGKEYRFRVETKR